MGIEHERQICNKCNSNIDILSLEVFKLQTFAIAQANECIHKI